MTKEMGGGGILDIGCYAASMARLLAGAGLGKPFADPIQVKGLWRAGADRRRSLRSGHAGVRERDRRPRSSPASPARCPLKPPSTANRARLVVTNPWLPS